MSGQNWHVEFQEKMHLLGLSHLQLVDPGQTRNGIGFTQLLELLLFQGILLLSFLCGQHWLLFTIIW
jgi:hypothetical protein